MQWISFKGIDGQKFVNLDRIEEVLISKKEIILCSENVSYRVSKEALPETYELLKDYFEQRLDYYKIN